MVYMLLVPLIARLLCWPSRMLSVAVSVAFVPFAPWSFERRIRAELTACVARHRWPEARRRRASPKR